MVDAERRSIRLGWNFSWCCEFGFLLVEDGEEEGGRGAGGRGQAKREARQEGGGGPGQVNML